jgi:L-lactate utilization protein LutC
MSGEREAFLDRVRRAVKAGNRAGSAPPLPDRGTIGYQGAGADPIRCFCAELTAAGGVPHLVASPDAALETVMEIVRGKSARRVLLGRGLVLDKLPLFNALRAAGMDVVQTDARPADGWRDAAFAADVGISGVDHLVAETGSLALNTRPDQPRGLSLLPPVHIAVADQSQLLPDLFDLFERGEPPSCLTLITGPSKTGDIELRLVTGVHGPGEVHVVLISQPLAALPT